MTYPKQYTEMNMH